MKQGRFSTSLPEKKFNNISFTKSLSAPAGVLERNTSFNIDRVMYYNLWLSCVFPQHFKLPRAGVVRHDAIG